MVTKEKVEKLIANGQCRLLPSQTEICISIVNRIYRKMKVGIQFSEIQVHEELVIVNGHHRYIASMLTGKQISGVP